MDQTFYTAPEPAWEPQPEPTPTVPDRAETRCRFSLIGLSLTVLMAVMVIAIRTVRYVVFFVSPASLDAWWMNWVLSILPLYAVALPCAYLILRKVPVTPHNPTYLDSYKVTREKTVFGFGHWILLLVIGLGCVYLGNLVGNIIMNTLSELLNYDYANALNKLMENSPVWMILVGTCICAPIGEELIFRKLLLDRVRGFGELPAILLSGLLFGLFHGNLFQFFYAFLLGMILAYIYTRSGKLGWCIAMHAAVNLIGSIVVPRIAALVPTDPEAELTVLQVVITLLLSAWLYGLIIVAGVLICALWHKRKLSPGSTPLPAGKAAAWIYGNPGMILCLVVLILLLAVALIPHSLTSSAFP